MHLQLLLSVLVVTLSSSSGHAFEQAQKAAAAKKAGAARTVDITGGDDMKYNLATIEAKRGEQLRIRLTTTGKMPKIAMAHNVVVLKPDTNQADFANAAAQARDTDFIPPSMKDQVIASTALAGPGETVETTFKVPAKPGEYPFLCSFPGHVAAGMKGTLVVK